MLRYSWGYVILCVGFLLVFISYGIRYGYGILIPPMKASLSLSDVQSGLIASSYFFSYTISAPFIGIIADKFSGKTVIPLLGLIMGLGTFTMGFATDWIFCASLFALVGFGSHAGWISIMRFLADWFEAEKRGRAMGIASSGYGVGYGLVGMLLPFIVRMYGWRWGWHLLGSFTLLLALASFFLLKERSPDSTETTEARTVQKILFSANFWFIAFSYLCLAFATNVLMTFLVSYFNLDLSIDYTIASGLVSVVAFSGIPGSLILPSISDKIGRKESLILCNLAIAASVFGYVVVGADILLLACLAIVYGVFYAATFPIYAASASEYFKLESSGSVLGLWTLFYGVGATVSPTVAGFMRELMRSYSPAFTLSATIMVLSVILLLPISRPRSK